MQAKLSIFEVFKARCPFQSFEETENKADLKLDGRFPFSTPCGS